MSAFEKDIHTVIASPRPGGAHHPDAIAIEADCGHGAWIDPLNLAGLRARGVIYRTMCMPCFLAGNGPDGPSVVTPEVLERMQSLGWTEEQTRGMAAHLYALGRRARRRRN